MYGTNHEDEKKTQASKIDGSNFHTLAREIMFNNFYAYIYIYIWLISLSLFDRYRSEFLSK